MHGTARAMQHSASCDFYRSQGSEMLKNSNYSLQNASYAYTQVLPTGCTNSQQDIRLKNSASQQSVDSCIQCDEKFESDEALIFSGCHPGGMSRSYHHGDSMETVDLVQGTSSNHHGNSRGKGVNGCIPEEGRLLSIYFESFY